MNERVNSLLKDDVTFCLLGASYNTGNRGVAALASGTINCVLHSFPGARIFLLDYDREPSMHLVRYSGGMAEVELVNLRFSKKVWLRNNIARLVLTALGLRLLPSRGLRESLIARNPYLKRIHKADIIGSISGGDSFSDIYGLGRLIYVALPQILVLLLGKPLLLMPQTIGPFKGPIAKTVARYIIKRVRMVYSRDHESLKTIREILVNDQKQVGFCYDMGFVLEPHIRDERIPSWLIERDKVTPLVGLNVSGLLYIGGYTQDNMFSLKGDYRKLVRDLIGHFVEKHNAHVLLVPHVFGEGGDSESDLSACRMIYEGADDKLRGNLHLIEEGYDHHELKALIGRCEYFLGSRMHACIAAISQCVPAVGLAYSRKFKGVFASIGMEELVIDLREYDEKSIIPLVDRVYQRRAELRAQLEAKMPDVRAFVLELFGRYTIAAEQRR